MNCLAIDPGSARTGLAVVSCEPGQRPVILSVYVAPADISVSAARRSLARFLPDLIAVEASTPGWVQSMAAMVLTHELAVVEGRIFNALGIPKNDPRMWRRHDVLAMLGIKATRGKGRDDKAVKMELCRRFGVDLYAREKLCPRRKNKSHGTECPICHGTGLEREAGRLAGFEGKAKQDASDAIALGLAALVREGVL